MLKNRSGDHESCDICVCRVSNGSWRRRRSSEHHAGELNVLMVALCHICVTVRKQSHDSTASEKKGCDSYVLSSDV